MGFQLIFYLITDSVEMTVQHPHCILCNKRAEMYGRQNSVNCPSSLEALQRVVCDDAVIFRVGLMSELIIADFHVGNHFILTRS